MSEIINPILQWLNTHPELSGLGTFIISAAESIAIIGTIVPGSVMMTAIGTLAGSGVIPLWPTIFWAILGAVVGDGISYWIGYRFKHRLYYVWPFRTRPQLLTTGEAFFKKYGGMSVFIGRFVGPVRALVPLVAGMLGMKPLQFYIANILSAIGWAPAYMLPGIILGAASLELPPDIAVHAILVLLLGTLFFILCAFIIYKSFILVGSNATHFLNWTWSRLAESRYFHSITTVLRHYNPKKTHGQLTLAFYIILFGLVFLCLGLYVELHNSKDITINTVFFHLFRSSRTPLLDNIMLSISMLGEATLLIALAIGLSLWLLWNKRWYTAFHVLALVIVMTVSIELFKYIFQISRPWGIMHSPRGFSFPSGHAASTTAFFIGFALLLTKAYEGKYSRFFYSLAGLIIILVSISRMYLGAHWFTDILGGIFLGSTILMLIVLSYNRMPEKNLDPKGILLVTFFILIITSSIYASFNFTRFKFNYAQMEWPSYSLIQDEWWNQKGKHLPLYRINRFGLSTQLLNLQWIGDINQIHDLLLKNGWEIPPQQDWIDVLHRISDVESAEHLPLVSPLHLDKEPVLVLIKHTNNKKLTVLRLWNSNMIISDSKQLLWVGSVENVPRTFSWLFKRRTNGLNLTPDLVFTTLPQQEKTKEITVKTANKYHPLQKILLIKPK